MNRWNFSCPQLAVMALLAGVCFPGCSDMKVAPVSGVVTLDGAPLPRASVTFEPKKGGRLSYGVTDAKGFYSLEYSMEQMGAEVGTSQVSVKTGARADDAGNPAVPEKVPAKYFQKKIEVEVEKKSNTINIELTSK